MPDKKSKVNNFFRKFLWIRTFYIHIYTGMFTYKQFFSHLLTEMYYGKAHKEDDLPENRPYGFMVYPDGTFGIAHSMMSHDDLVGGASNIVKIINLGGIRVAISGEGDATHELYYMEYMRTKATQRAIKTAKDLAAWYGLHPKFVEFDRNQYADL